LANGTVIGDNEFMLLEPGCDFCLATEAEHDWCTIFVPTRLLVRRNGSEDPSSASEKTVCRVTPANRQLADRFRAIIEQVINVPTNCPRFASSPAASCAASEMLDIAVEVVGQKETERRIQVGRPRLPRREIVRRSLQFLEERPTEPVSLKEMAAVSGASERTLRTAFKEYFGVGPIRYLRLRKLNQVQRVLRGSDVDAVSVGDVLIEHGVWEFSRFASWYRRLFGELPSETLRANVR
jgi:AraC-like DNA-binding protein